MFLSPSFEEIYLGQQFDVKITYLGFYPEPLQDFFSKLSVAKIFNKSRVEDRVRSLSDNPSIYVVRLDLNINRILKNCNHKEKDFELTAFVLKDSSGLEKEPTERPGVIQPGKRNFSNTDFQC